MDYYNTIEKRGAGLFKEKGSKFYSYAHPINSRSDFENLLEEIKKSHPKAGHHCFAYKLGENGEDFRSSDDGEPSGTAGRPILGSIDSFELTNIAIVVVRYFGGTKLGVSGLIQAYKSASHQAIQASRIIAQELKFYYKLEYDYAHMGVVMNAMKSLGFKIDKVENVDTPSLFTSFLRSEASQNVNKLYAFLLGYGVEDITEDTEIDYLTVTKIGE